MNTKITYEEFVNKVDKLHEQVKENWRYGQTYFAVLSSVRSDLAETIRATIYDPFHKEQVSEQTEKLLKDKWNV